MTLINQLDAFARQNTFLSLITIGILINFLSNILKSISLYTIKKGSNFTSNKSKENIQYYIDYLKEEILRVKKVHDKEPEILFELVGGIYETLFLILAIIFGYYFTIWVFPVKGFYAFFGASSWMIKRIIGTIYFNYRLTSESENYNNYKISTEKKIEKYSKLIS